MAVASVVALVVLLAWQKNFTVMIIMVVSVQDLKGKILVKGKKEYVLEECSLSASDFSSSDEEASQTEGRPHQKKEDKKVGYTTSLHLS